MKKNILRVLAGVAILIAGVLIYKTVGIVKHNNQVIAGKQSFPKFHFYNLDSKPLNYDQILPGKAVCIFYYNAECEFCQDEVKHLKQKIEAFNDIQILMVSTNPPKETLQFAKDYELADYKNITWIYDKDFSFYKWFGNTVTPSVFIYNSKHSLIKEYRGEVKIEAVLKSINNDKKS